MCSNIIIDVNKASGFTNPQKSECDALLYEYIKKKHFKVRYPHPKDPSFESDMKNNKWNNLLEEWKSSGIAKPGSKESSQSIQALENTNQLKSNDAHILALAKDTDTYILYTNDNDLMKDFTNPQIMGMNNKKRYCYMDNDLKKAKSFLENHKCPKKS